MFNLHEIKLELTYKCALMCVHCSSEGSQDHIDTITPGKAMEIVLSAKNLGVKKVSLSGGEPFIWEDIVGLSNFINELRIKQNIYTCGVHNDFASIIKYIPRESTSLIFSLYASNQRIHDSITNVKNSFHKTIQSIKIATELGFQTEIHFVPLKSNFLEITSLIEYLKDINVHKVSILRFVPQGRGADNDKLDLDAEQYCELRNIIIKLREEGHIVRTGSPFNFLMINENPLCTSGLNKLIIAPDLHIYPCDAFKQVSSKRLFGNDPFSSLNEYSLEECWKNSRYLNVIREVLKRDFDEPCKSCKYKKLCRSGCLAQRYLKCGTLNMSNDPMCIVQNCKYNG